MAFLQNSPQQHSKFFATTPRQVCFNSAANSVEGDNFPSCFLVRAAESHAEISNLDRDVLLENFDEVDEPDLAPTSSIASTISGDFHFTVIMVELR